MSLINAMDHLALSGFATAVALALDLDADADSDAILSTLQRRLNTPPAPRNVEGFERDQLVKICQYLTEHRQGDPAVTFDNAPELVCAVINDYREAEHLRAYHAEHVGEHVGELQEAAQPKRESWVTVRDLREQLDQLDTAYSVGAFEDGQPANVMQALRQLVKVVAEKEAPTVKRTGAEKQKEVLVSVMRGIAKTLGLSDRLNDRQDAQCIARHVEVMAEDNETLRRDVCNGEETLRQHIERMGGGRPENVWPALEEAITALILNQKPEGFDQAAEDMVERLRRYELAFASVRNLVALV